MLFHDLALGSAHFNTRDDVSIPNSTVLAHRRASHNPTRPSLHTAVGALTAFFDSIFEDPEYETYYDTALFSLYLFTILCKLDPSVLPQWVQIQAL